MYKNEIKFYPIKFLTGQATLAFIILISGLILEIAVAGSFVTYFLSSSGMGERLSVRALSVASSGIRDAQIRLVRLGSLCGDLSPYSFSIDQDIANISSSRELVGENCEYTITSLGAAGTRQRKLVAVLLMDTTTGLAELRSVNERPVQ
jgi:hypothetical protein